MQGVVNRQWFRDQWNRACQVGLKSDVVRANQLIGVEDGLTKRAGSISRHGNGSVVEVGHPERRQQTPLFQFLADQPATMWLVKSVWSALEISGDESLGRHGLLSRLSLLQTSTDGGIKGEANGFSLTTQVLV